MDRGSSSGSPGRSGRAGAPSRPWWPTACPLPPLSPPGPPGPPGPAEASPHQGRGPDRRSARTGRHMSRPSRPQASVQPQPRGIRSGLRGLGALEDAIHVVMVELPSPVQLAGCTVDLVRRRVERDGRQLVLTRLEADLLAYLMERAGRDVPREELLTEVWGYAATSSSRAVDFAVRRLRNKLGEPRSPLHILTAHGVGYRFVPLAPDASPSPGGPVVSRPPVRLATGLLDLERRTFKPAVGEEQTISRLEGELIESLLSAPGQTIPREDVIRRVWGWGDHASSLDAAVRRLRLKLEVEPSRPEVLVTVRGSGLRLETLAPGGPTARRTNLVAASTRFIPRPETEALGAALSHPLVTVVGTAGMGKTRLVQEVGAALLDEHPGIEVWFCDLSSAVSEHGVVRAVEAALGLEKISVGDPVQRISHVLARRPPGTVVVLDNFEQVKASAPLLERWMAAAPSVRLVVTSREHLGLPGERCLRLEPLTIEAAAQLFVDRTHDDRLDPGDESVRALVARLDCLPLAIELAAARSDQLSPQDLLDRLDRRLDLLIRRPMGAVTHHSTLRGALDWSWDLLSEAERTALAEASLFEGSFSIARAEAVIGVFDVAGSLDSLCTRSLMHHTSDDGYRLDEGIRAYAREKLQLAGEERVALERYRQVHLTRGEACAAGLRGHR
ncbi:MAG TPA: NACHT domain-containing protein, partial [Deltaproteobacteria bacterium]|nr:NACHT domain-containing protein [Deltaproteobacteria bacterium]